jgi:hypothetical protein
MLNNEHHTIPYAKVHNIDDLILPAVVWLNDLDGVHTLHSCQGEIFAEPYNEQAKHAYVMFVCRNPFSLLTIVETALVTKWELQLYAGTLTYTIRWSYYDLRLFYNIIL